jgi:hypothetical protein
MAQRLTGDAAEKLPLDQLAQLDYDKSIQFFAMVPLALILALAVAYFALYLYRRTRSWNELGEAMRVHEEPQGVAAPRTTPESSLQPHSGTIA